MSIDKSLRKRKETPKIIYPPDLSTNPVYGNKLPFNHSILTAPIETRSLEADFLREGIDINTVSTTPMTTVLPILVHLESDTSNPISGDALDILIDLASTRSEEFAQTIISLLDFDNKNNFDKTSEVLLTIKMVYGDLHYIEGERIASSGGFWGSIGANDDIVNNIASGTRSIKEHVARAVREKKGNYILNRQIEEILKIFDDHVYGEKEFADIVINQKRIDFGNGDLSSNTFLAGFRLPVLNIKLTARKVFGYWVDGVYRLSQESSYSEIQTLFTEYEQLNQEYAQPKITVANRIKISSRANSIRKQIEELCALELESKSLTIHGDHTIDNKSLLKDFLYILGDDLMKIVQNDFHANFQDLTLQEIAYLVSYLKTVSIEESEHLQVFSKTHGINGLRTFLVTAQNETLRKQVFEFAESMSPDDVRLVFEAYGSLITSIDIMGEKLQQLFGERGQQARTVLVGKMFDRARTLLQTAYIHRDMPESIVKLIQSVSAENVIFYEAFRELRRQGSIEDFSSIEGLAFTSVDQSNESISEHDRNEMIRITRENYAHTSEEFKSSVVKGLTSAFDTMGTQFFILRFKDKIIGFNRFDTLPPAADGYPRKYFGSFNVDPSYGNGKLGDVMIEQTVGFEAQSAIIEAHCLPNAPITQRYLKDGFKVVGEDASLYPEPVWHIVLDKRITETH